MVIQKNAKRKWTDKYTNEEMLLRARKTGVFQKI